MNVLTNAEFAAQVMALAQPAEEFRPTAYYDPDGDCIEFLAKPDPFFAERVDDVVTVYYSQDTKEVVGSLIKGVSRFYKTLLQKMPGFSIEVVDGRVKIVHIFRANAWASTEESSGPRALTYRKLIEVAEASDVETELCGV